MIVLRYVLELVRQFHEDATGGHSGVTPTTAFHQSFIGKASNERCVSLCAIASRARFKPENIVSPGLLQALPIPEYIWTGLSMDFISGLLKSYSKTTILMVVGRLSKATHFVPLQHPFTAADVA